MNVALATAFVVASLFAGSEAQGGIKGQQQFPIYPPGPGTKGGWENGGGGGGFYGNGMGGGMGFGGAGFKGGSTKGQTKGGVPSFQPQQQFPFPPMVPPQRTQLPPGQQQFFG